jgi:hypothetical protein
MDASALQAILELRGVDRSVPDNSASDGDGDHARSEHRQVSGHLANHEQHAEWGMGNRTEAGDHADNDETHR